ncbi:kinase-like protein [Xylaria telfairii]|nr:kinase-like protein [Xylaria telfairii]
MSQPNRTLEKQLRKQRFKAPQQAWKRLRTKLHDYEEGKYMKYNRVLGFGGFGIVQEWDILDEDGDTDYSVAIKTVVNKANRSSVQSLKNEIWWTKRFAGSEHLIQLINLDLGIMQDIEANDEYRHGELPSIIMEKMGRGSLHLLLYRLRFVVYHFNTRLMRHYRFMEYIPNRTLWQMFLCLTRACIGMAFPAANPLENRGYVIRESVPEGVNPSRIVHSDIDVQNVFIADPEDYPPDDEHPWAPKLKIADYGCMVEWDDDWTFKEKSNSLWGKNSYKAPEQFLPRAFDRNQLGPWTNVYQIGQVMHDLISQRAIPSASRSKKPRKIDGNTFETYGWRMLEEGEDKIEHDWKNVDLEMRQLVAGCMADQNWNRPPLAQLEKMIESRISWLRVRALYELKEKNEDPSGPNDPNDPNAPKGPIDVNNPTNPGGLANSQTLKANPTATLGKSKSPTKDSVPAGPPPKKPLDPESKEFVPGLADVPYPHVYRQRVPMGEVEPDYILKKFYKDYFVDKWVNDDKFDAYWGNKTLSSRPDSPQG